MQRWKKKLMCLKTREGRGGRKEGLSEGMELKEEKALILNKMLEEKNNLQYRTVCLQSQTKTVEEEIQANCQ